LGDGAGVSAESLSKAIFSAKVVAYKPA
jgi:hypothetical protein